MTLPDLPEARCPDCGTLLPWHTYCPTCNKEIDLGLDREDDS